MRESDRAGNEKPGCINIIIQIWALQCHAELMSSLLPRAAGWQARACRYVHSQACPLHTAVSMNASFLLPWTSELPEGLFSLFESEMSRVWPYA